MVLRRRTTRRRITDLALYINIGLSVVAFAADYAMHAVRTSMRGPAAQVEWILGFLGAHLTVYFIVLSRVDRFLVLWFVFIGYLDQV